MMRVTRLKSRPEGSDLIVIADRIYTPSQVSVFDNLVRLYYQSGLLGKAGCGLIAGVLLLRLKQLPCKPLLKFQHLAGALVLVVLGLLFLGQILAFAQPALVWIGASRYGLEGALVALLVGFLAHRTHVGVKHLKSLTSLRPPCLPQPT